MLQKKSRGSSEALPEEAAEMGGGALSGSAATALEVESEGLKIINIGDCGYGVTFVILQHKSKMMYYG